MKYQSIICLFIALATTPAEAQRTKAAAPRPMELCVGEAIYGFPTTKKQDTTKICRRGYSTEHDNVAKIPVWAAYVLTPIEATGCFARSSGYAPDLHLRMTARATPMDYAKSGYDIGHMVNDADMRWSLAAGQETFILSNMTPQLPVFNRGIWKKLEESTRGWTVNRKHPLQIYVGPIYDRDTDKRIGVGGVTVPNGFWKVIIDTQTNEVMVFKFDHKGARGDLSQFVTTLADLQRLTGLVLPMPKKPIFAAKTWPRIVKTIGRHKTLVCSLKTE